MKNVANRKRRVLICTVLAAILSTGIIAADITSGLTADILSGREADAAGKAVTGSVSESLTDITNKAASGSLKESLTEAADVLRGSVQSLTGLEAAYAETDEADAELVFSDSAVTESKSGEGYKISGTTLTITAAGTYRISGSCSEGSIEVKKGVTDVVLVFDGLTLNSGSSAPVVVKKSASAKIYLAAGTTNTLTDSEDPANETSSDADVADAFEGACIKVKSGSTLTFDGEGTLVCDGSACKNGIKGGSTAELVFDGGSYTVKAANNGIASDGSVTVNDGSFDIDAENDGIKSTPDATDETEGTTVDTESAGTVTINGGDFDIDVNGDGIQADTLLTINGGTFDIMTMAGYSTKGTKVATYDSGVTGVTTSGTFDADTMSCKGLKASGDRAEEVGTEPDLVINGGTFKLNTADDAVHSDGYCEIYGGTFTIDTGDDGAHADTSLTLGKEGSTTGADITVSHSYEGLESGNLYVYSGDYDVTATDDGINAAGGSSNGTNQGSGNDSFNRGGRPGGPGQQAQTSSGDYSLNIYGGNVYIDCNGDGLDSNGALNLTGGTIEVFSQSSGDNSSIDADGTVNIDGATVFTAGISPMMDPVSANWFGSSQKYATYSSRIAAGKTVAVTLNGTTIYSTKLPKEASYFMYSAPGLSAQPTIGIGTSSGTVDADDTADDGSAAGGQTGGSTSSGTSGSATGDTSGSTTGQGSDGSTTSGGSTENTANGSSTGENGTAAETENSSSSSAASTDASSTSVAAAKKNQPMTVTGVVKTIKRSVLKKAKKVFRAIKIKKAKGTVTYKVTGSKKARKYLKFSKKTGKVTVKKGTPKGKYVLKIKVTASGNDTYKKGSKTVKVVVKVK